MPETGSAKSSSSGSSGASCDQCPNPPLLYVTSSLGDCVLYPDGATTWKNIEGDGPIFSLRIQCTDNADGSHTWRAFVDDCAGGIFPVTENSCNPVDLTSVITEFYEGCGKNVTLHITE